MQTHRDEDHRPPRLSRHELNRSTAEAIEERARHMLENGESAITAGEPGERAIAETLKFCTFVRRMPDDPNGVLRVSVGMASAIFSDPEARYVVIRGDPAACADLLDRAARALRAGVPELDDRGGKVGGKRGG